MRNFSILLLVLAGCVAQEQALPREAPNPTEQSSHPLSCSAHRVLELNGPLLSQIAPDGTSRELFRLGAAAGLGADDVVVEQWEARGGFVAMAAYLYAPNAEARYEYVLLDREGQVRFHRIQGEPNNPQIYLASDGALAIAGGQGLVVRPDGTAIPMGNYRPVAAVLGTHVVVADGEPWKPGARFGWLELASGAFTPFAVEPFAYPSFTLLAGRALYPSDSGDLVVASPDETRVVDIDAGGKIYPLATTADQRFALFGTGDGTGVLRFDVRTFDVQELTYPDASPVRLARATLDPDGAVLMSFRAEDDRLQLRRTNDLGASWADVGEAMRPRATFGLGTHLVPIARGDRVLILNLAQGYGDFLEELQLVSPGGASQTLVAGGVYVNTDIHPGAADLSADGGCAVSWVGRQGTGAEPSEMLDLVFIDAALGTSGAVRTGPERSILRFQE